MKPPAKVAGAGGKQQAKEPEEEQSEEDNGAVDAVLADKFKEAVKVVGEWNWEIIVCLEMFLKLMTSLVLRCCQGHVQGIEGPS